MSILTIRWFSLVLLAFLALSLFSACSQNLPVQKFRLLAFGTYIDVEVIGVDQERAEVARKQLQQDFDAMQYAWHAWDPGPLGYINESIHKGLERIPAPPSTLPLIRISQTLAEKSDYLFDPAIGRLIELWGFHRSVLSPHAPPSAEDIEVLLHQAPSIRDLNLQDFHLSSTNSAVRLDFGAIGKGYGVDQAILRLNEIGIENAVVNAGGDLRAIGSRAGTPWRIAIRDPAGGGVLGWLPIKGNGAVFTSGNYERNFIWDGKFYHHIIDPRTGYPAEGSASVTVLHSDATTADAAATALFIAGPKDWPRIAQQMGVDMALLVGIDGVVYMSPKMADKVKLRKPVKKVIVELPGEFARTD